MNAQVKNIIEEHARRRKQGQLGSDGITEGMQKDLRALVGEKIWKKAVSVLEHSFLLGMQKVANAFGLTPSLPLYPLLM